MGQTDPIHCRKLTEANLDKIAKEISLSNYEFIDSESNTNDKWLLFKSKLIDVFDRIAFIVTNRPKIKEQFPWEDKSLIEKRNLRLIISVKVKKLIVSTTKSNINYSDGNISCSTGKK